MPLCCYFIITRLILHPHSESMRVPHCPPQAVAAPVAHHHNGNLSPAFLPSLTLPGRSNQLQKTAQELTFAPIIVYRADDPCLNAVPDPRGRKPGGYYKVLHLYYKQLFVQSIVFVLQTAPGFRPHNLRCRCPNAFMRSCSGHSRYMFIVPPTLEYYPLLSQVLHHRQLRHRICTHIELSVAIACRYIYIYILAPIIPAMPFPIALTTSLSL